MAKGPWKDTENDLIVADYFPMLADDISGRPYSKADHNRRLQNTLQRGRGSIEYKHQNVSAVLKGMGQTWITGYKPAFNFQLSLVDAVERWLRRNSAFLIPETIAARVGPGPPEGQLFVGPPPTSSNQPPPNELDQMLAIARKFDVAGRDERNRALGRAGEQLVLAHERAILKAEGRADLASRVKWISNEEGDGAGYDIASYTREGAIRLIEVKTTNGWERTPFHITRNELAVSEQRRDEWYLFRLWNFAREPRAFEIRPPLDASVTLIATNFEAHLH